MMILGYHKGIQVSMQLIPIFGMQPAHFSCVCVKLFMIMAVKDNIRLRREKMGTEWYDNQRVADN